MSKPQYTKAAAYASLMHKDQKYGQRPYTFHLNMVVDIVRANGGSIEQITTAWLHDTIEDTSATRNDIEQQFGKEVADMVWALTGIGQTRDECIDNAIEKIATTPGAGLIKLADRFANVTACIDDGKTQWLGKYIQEYKRLRPVLPDIPLLRQLDLQIEKAKSLAAAEAITEAEYAQLAEPSTGSASTKGPSI